MVGGEGSMLAVFIPDRRHRQRAKCFNGEQDYKGDIGLEMVFEMYFK